MSQIFRSKRANFSFLSIVWSTIQFESFRSIERHSDRWRDTSVILAWQLSDCGYCQYSWSGYHFYENSTCGLVSFFKRWSHRQHIDKRLAWRQTINDRQATLASGFFSYKVTLLACGSGPAQILFLLIITLLYSIYIYFVPYTLSTRFSLFIHLITSTNTI